MSRPIEVTSFKGRFFPSDLDFCCSCGGDLLDATYSGYDPRGWARSRAGDVYCFDCVKVMFYNGMLQVAMMGLEPKA